MRKTMKILSIITALCAVFAISAFAADFEHCADAMNELGIFRGTDKGYELDRAPTRAEAAAMLVRLLGAEEEALALTYTAPFTDVADWAKPYVQYLYDKGLTRGTSDTSFGASDLCTKEQYVTFLLRVLGYTEGEDGDFEYGDDARWFAEEVNLLDGSNYPWYGFYRDNMAAMTYTALALPTKPLTATLEEVILLEKLVGEGKITGAEKLLAHFEDYREFNAAFRDFAEAKKVSATVITETLNEDNSGYGKMRIETSYVLEKVPENPDKNRFFVDVSERFERKSKSWKSPDIQEESWKMYYKDGYAYRNKAEYIFFGDDREKIKAEASFEDLQPILADLSEYEDIPVCDFAKAEKEEKGRKVTVYRMETGGKQIRAEIKDGKLLSVKSENELSDGSAAISVENIKTDGTVIVRYPMDLHLYKDVTGQWSPGPVLPY